MSREHESSQEFDPSNMQFGQRIRISEGPVGQDWIVCNLPKGIYFSASPVSYNGKGEELLTPAGTLLVDMVTEIHEQWDFDRVIAAYRRVWKNDDLFSRFEAYLKACVTDPKPKYEDYFK